MLGGPQLCLSFGKESDEHLSDLFATTFVLIFFKMSDMLWMVYVGLRKRSIQVPFGQGEASLSHKV